MKPLATPPVPHRAQSRPRPALRAGPIKLVAIDLDGTLLTSRKTVTPKTHAAIKAALAQGVHIVLATARPPRSVLYYHQRLKLTTPMINYNGALIWDPIARKVIEHNPLERAVARKVINFTRKKFPKMHVHVEILDKWYTDHFEDNPEFMTETGKYFMPDFVGPIEAFLQVDITKLMLLGQPEWIAEIEQLLPRRFGDDIATTRSDGFLLQVMSPGVSKAVALQHVAKMLGVDSRHVMACGDAPNDIHMLQWAGLAIAPENAFEITKSVAHYIVPSNDHDGIGAALRRFVINGSK